MTDMPMDCTCNEVYTQFSRPQAVIEQKLSQSDMDAMRSPLESLLAGINYIIDGMSTPAYAADSIVNLDIWSGKYTIKGQDFPGKIGQSWHMTKDEWLSKYNNEPSLHKFTSNPTIFNRVMGQLTDGDISNDEIDKVFYTDEYIVFRVLSKNKCIDFSEETRRKYNYPSDIYFYSVWTPLSNESFKILQKK